MKALDRKLLRDLKLMWSQALTVALVVASGIGGFLTTLSAVDSLDSARDRFYAQGRFDDVFVAVKRAPDANADTLRAIPGVAKVFKKLISACYFRAGWGDAYGYLLVATGRAEVMLDPIMNSGTADPSHRFSVKQGDILGTGREMNPFTPARLSPPI